MTNRLHRSITLSLMAGVLSISGGVASADELAEQGRAILAKHQEAVVTIQMVLKQKMSFGGQSQDNESKTETTGTVIGEDGLTVVSLSETDPSSIIESMMGGMGGQLGNLNIDTEISDVKILKKDGSEIDAEVILRDKDLDLAFIRPITKPDSAMPYVALEDSGAPELLDQVIALNRLGRVAGRVHSASVERVEAIVERPRTFYIPGDEATLTGMGSPAFTLDGKIIGIFVVRAIKTSDGGLMGMMSGRQDNMTSIILPASDILEAAAQAPPFEE